MMNNGRFNELDSSLFKAFLHAARELNFTRAAEKAAMTQSGVSQKISKLEQQVGQSLFLRVNKSISLTEAGLVLLDYIERQQDELDGLFEKLGVSQKSPKGPVRYAMPHSCLFTPHFPLMLEERKKFAAVTLKVSLCSNEDVTQMLLNWEIDFGFLTRKSENPALAQDLFAAEEYVLVGSPDLIKKLKPTLENLHSLPFVNFPGMQNLFDSWKRVMAAKKRSLSFEALAISGEINSLHGAVTMIFHGVGFAIVPRHVVATELKQHEIEIVRMDIMKEVRSEIFIATIAGANLPSRVQAVLDAFNAMKWSSLSVILVREDTIAYRSGHWKY